LKAKNARFCHLSFGAELDRIIVDARTFLYQISQNVKSCSPIKMHRQALPQLELFLGRRFNHITAIFAAKTLFGSSMGYKLIPIAFRTFYFMKKGCQ